MTVEIQICREDLAALWKGIASETIEQVCQKVEAAAQPRWTYAEYSCGELSSLWLGNDIRRHLAGCSRCVLIAVTLGVQTDRLLRRAGTADVVQQALFDAAASALIEAWAAHAEASLRDIYRKRALYLTRRFSPGYGDFPISGQPEFLRLTGAEKKIGLTVTDTCILVPRKSVTAVCGIADHPVTGTLAGCATCALRETCKRRKEGILCGTFDS